MSEVVVRIDETEARDSSLLSNALDAFARWAEQAGFGGNSDDAPDIMMMTEHTGGGVQRKLIFQSGDHAERFMLFWSERLQRATPANDVL